MKVAVIGGGFTGLACAATLVDEGNEIVLFESSDHLGGLAGGFKEKDWNWILEDFYHHIFTNDKEIIGLADKVGWPVKIYSPLTTSFIEGQEIPLDSPISVLRFSKIMLFSRIHMGVGLGILKLIPNGLFLERYRVVDFLPKLIGREAYEKIWLKLLKAKFGSKYTTVNMAWFWTRVAKRTKNLGYFEGGFETLANKIGEYIEKKGGVIRLNSEVATIRSNGSRNDEDEERRVFIDGEKFDAVVITTPAPIAKKIYKDVFIPKIDYLWGQTLILEIKERLIMGYWMNILENNWPFLVAVEHTNMIDKKNYGGNRIIYLGNYLEEGHTQLKMSKEKIIDLYLPFLKKINPNFQKKWIIKSFLARKPYSQPVFPVNYSQEIPKDFTVDGRVFIANMSMVYPFDRGTNYAVKMGTDVAKRLHEELR